eukprot:221576_1
MAVSAGFWSLLLGRLVTGIGAGAGLVLSPLYTAEISPSRFRGRLVTLAEFFINLGIVLGYLCSYLLENLSPTVGWRVMLGLGGVPAICMLFGLLVMPESPRWLVQQGRHEEAEYSLGLTHWPDEAQDSLEKISESVRIAERTHKHTWRALITSRVFVIGMGLGLSQQISGIEVSVYYTPQLLEDAGISSRDLILLASLCLGAIKLVSIVAAGRYIDQVGRRRLLLLSETGVLAALLVIALDFWMKAGSGLALFGIALMNSAFSIGLGPVTWVTIAEIFPLEVRGRAMGAATSVNRLTSGVVALSFLSLTHLLTIGGTFFMFAILC